MFGVGVIFKLDPAGEETTLYHFTGGADGDNPQSGVTLDAAGNIYGTTFYGGSSNGGVVYKLDTSGNLMVLHAFAGGADGAGPVSDVTLDSAGNVYGTTSVGGLENKGVVYKVDTAGVETILFTFTGGSSGSEPFGGVIRDPAGKLYGTTVLDGSKGGGVVFELSSQ